jgi:hypothetical protein
MPCVLHGGDPTATVVQPRGLWRKPTHVSSEASPVAPGYIPS